MKSFAAWGLTLLGLAVVATIAEMLLPKGRLQNVIRAVVSSVAVLAMVTPLPDLINKGFSFDFTSTDVSVAVDDGYLEYVADVKKKLIVESLYEFLEKNGYGGIEASVETDGQFQVISAVIKFPKTGMTENDEHINKSEIIGLVANYLQIGEEAIMTYG